MTGQLKEKTAAFIVTGLLAVAVLIAVSTGSGTAYGDPGGKPGGMNASVVENPGTTASWQDNVKPDITVIVPWQNDVKPQITFTPAW